MVCYVKDKTGRFHLAPMLQRRSQPIETVYTIQVMEEAGAIGITTWWLLAIDAVQEKPRSLGD